MTQQAVAPAAPTQPAAPVAQPSSSDENGLGLQGDTFEERLAALQGQIIAEEGTSQPAGDAAPATAPSSATPQANAPASPADSAEKRTADRRERLARLSAQERERLDSQRRRVENTRASAELAEVKKQLDSRIDRELLKDPIAALALLEEQGITSDKVVEAIRERMANPDARAAYAAKEAAKKHLDPQVQALQATIAQQQQVLDQLLEHHRTTTQKATEAQYMTRFQNYASSNSDLAPTAAKLLEADPAEFWQMVEVAGERLPKGAGEQALLDQVEELLTTEGRPLAEKMARLYGLLPENNSTATHSPPKNAAAKATTTVTNSIAQERASVVTDSDPMAGMTFEERVEYLKRHM